MASKVWLLTAVGFVRIKMLEKVDDNHELNVCMTDSIRVPMSELTLTAYLSASNDGGEICGGMLMMRSLTINPTS